MLEKTIIFLFGAIALSPLSTVIFVDYMKMGTNYIEIIMLPFLFYIFNAKKIKLKDSDLIIITFIILGLLFYSLLINKYSITSLVSTARAYYWLLFFFIIFKNGMVFSKEEINLLFWGSLVAWAIVATTKGFLIQSSNAREFNGNELSYGNVIVGVYLIQYYYFTNQYKKLLLLESLIVIISLFSGLRRFVVIFGIANLVIVFKIVISRSFTEKVLLLIFVILSALIFNLYSRYMEENNALLYHRVVSKTYSIFGVENELTEIDNSDTRRRSNYSRLFDDMSDYIYPRGFTSKRTSIDLDTGFYIDCPPAEFLYTFGIPFSLLILLFVYFDFMSIYKITNHFDDTYSKILLFTMVIFVINFLFLDGTNIAFVNLTPLTGMIIGMFSSLRCGQYNQTENTNQSNNSFDNSLPNKTRDSVLLNINSTH